MYEDFGGQSQPSYTTQETAPKPEPKSRKKYIIAGVIGIVIIIGAIFAYNMFFGPNNSENNNSTETPEDSGNGPNNTIGNGICDSGENCWDNKADCSCKEGEYCSFEDKICLKPVCGNGKSEYFETPDNCCIDAGCYDGEVCNKELKMCEKKEFNLSEEETKQLITDHFQKQNLSLQSINLTKMVSTIENEVGINVMVTIGNDSWFTPVVVLQNKTVYEPEKR
jgi:hypothetical protein